MQKNKKLFNDNKWLGILVAFGLSAVFLWYMQLAFIQEEENSAVHLSQSVSTMLVPEMVEGLTGTHSDIVQADYLLLKERLKAFKSQNKAIRFAYLLMLRDDKVFFLVDNEESNSPDYSPPGQEYFEATASYKSVFVDGMPHITDPIEDRWGTWVTVLVPVRSSRTGEIIAVFGTDYAANEWSSKISDKVSLSIIIVLCLNVLLLGFYWILQQNRHLRRMEKELVTSEAAFRSVFHQAPVGIAVTNSTEEIQRINTEFLRILGRDEDELKSINWRRLTHPDDINKDEALFKDFMDRKIDEYAIEKRYIRPDGQEIWVLMQISKYDVGNSNDRNYLCIITDISERKKIETVLKESERSKTVLLSNLPGMAYRLDVHPDQKERVTFLSEGCLSLTGYHPKDLILSRDLNLRDLIAPEYRAGVLMDSSQLLKVHKAYRHEYEIITSEGRRKWVLDLGQGVYDEVDKLIAIEGIVIDITDLKSREAEITFLSQHDYLTNLFNRRYFEGIKDSYDVAENLPLAIVIVDINGLRIINDAFGHSEGDYLIGVAAQIILKCCSDRDIVSRTGGEFRILMTSTNEIKTNAIAVAIRREVEAYNAQQENLARHINLSVGFGIKSELEKTWKAVVTEAEEYLYKRKLMERQSYRSSQISSIMATLYARSEETEEHSQRLSHYCKAVGNVLGLSQKDLDELELLSMLHDIGKIGINDNILNKPGSLTEAEWTEMKRHPEIGYRIIAMVPELVSVAEFVLSHHERWDGTGYPHGLKGTEIPLHSRILSIVDAYDAMTEHRVYRKALEVSAAMEELRKHAGSQFDPSIVEIFLEVLKN